ncbi:TetR/AcrR family transcriptional regulator [Streptomyces chartreusis]
MSVDGEARPRREGRAASRRESILLAAEKLFAMEGYHGTSIRDVAREAGEKLSLAVYHFETKQKLYFSIFERRQYVNEERLARLRAITDLRAESAVSEIIDAFADPVLELHKNPDDIWFAQLVLREAADPSSQDREVISTLFDPLAREFIRAFQVALPEKSPEFHHWAYLFSVGALTQSAFDARLSHLADAPYQDDKARLLKSYLVAAFTFG